MDNVPTLAIQAPIILAVPSMLSPTAVSSMTGDMVAKLAAESEEQRSCREELERRRETLENGARICKQYAMRPSHCKLVFEFVRTCNRLTRQAGRGAPVETGQFNDRHTMLNETQKVRLYPLPFRKYCVESPRPDCTIMQAKKR